MDLFRLTYFVGVPDREKWDCSSRFEVYGSREAIADLYFHLSNLERLSNEGKHESACPRFLEIRNKDGVPCKVNNMSNDNTFS